MRKIAKAYPHTQEFLGLSASLAGVPGLYAYIERVIGAKEMAVIPHLNIHGACLAWKRPELIRFYQESQFVFCDGDGIRWGMRLLGLKPPPKITLTRLIWDFSDFCGSRRYRVFILGGKPGVAEEAAGKLKEKFPAFDVAGTHHGFFQHTGPENEKVLEQIRRSDAQIVLVCFGMPHQEFWIAKNKDELDVSVFLCGGGVLDYTTGKLGRAPQWMLTLNLEWLFRIWDEPERLLGRYAAEIPYFFWQVIKGKWMLKK